MQTTDDLRSKGRGQQDSLVGLVRGKVSRSKTAKHFCRVSRLPRHCSLTLATTSWKVSASFLFGAAPTTPAALARSGADSVSSAGKVALTTAG